MVGSKLILIEKCFKELRLKLSKFEVTLVTIILQIIRLQLGLWCCCGSVKTRSNLVKGILLVLTWTPLTSETCLGCNHQLATYQKLAIAN